ncbi:hypothetical protein EVJ58_g8229, partial [Rhodofomes roseus]
PAGADDPGHLHMSHQGRRAIPPDTAEEVNRWAFVAEKVLHGNPSGVDNSVAVFGGALAYTRPGFGKKSGMEQIQGFKSLRFLLVDSRVPRDTKKLVAGVAMKKAEEPEVVSKIMDAIQAISDEARRALADPELPRPSLLDALSALIDENHAHLVSLGVSHPSLELIRSTTATDQFGLSTKLTGAGGGGCAVTLVPDDFSDASLQALVSALEGENFRTYTTSVGGSGLGILSPYNKEHESALATPPETPLEQDMPAVPSRRSAKDTFQAVELGSLSSWAEDLGRWMFV